MPALPALLLLLGSAAATQITVRTAPCPLGEGPVRIYEQVSADSAGGYDSDLARYSAQGQFREYAVASCADNLFSLLGEDMASLPLDAAMKARLEARLAEVRATLPPPEEIPVWDRYRLAVEMYRTLGRDPVFLGDLLLQASWTARDHAVGITTRLDGPQAARALLELGATELGKELPPQKRKVLLHNLARAAHRGGWPAARDRHLAAFEAVGALDADEQAALGRFRVGVAAEAALQDQALAEYERALSATALPAADRARVRYLVADLHRRRGRPEAARPLFEQVVADPSADPQQRNLAQALLSDLARSPAP